MPNLAQVTNVLMPSAVLNVYKQKKKEKNQFIHKDMGLKFFVKMLKIGMYLLIGKIL